MRKPAALATVVLSLALVGPASRQAQIRTPAAPEQ
jgi:hypothetical protein